MDGLTLLSKLNEQTSILKSVIVFQLIGTWKIFIAL